MSETQLSCDDYEALLPRHLEDELSAAELDQVERHLATCRRCWALRDELLDIARAARELAPLSPSHDLWHGVAERIEAPVISIDTGEHEVPRRRRSYRMVGAAAALVVATAGATFTVVRQMYGPGQSVATLTPPPGPPAQTVGLADPAAHQASSLIVLASEQLGPADAAYAREIAQLRAALERRRPNLDSGTVAIIERNLAIIDSAIVRTQAALRRAPQSALLSRQLDRALGKKVEVLRSAVLLPTVTD